MDPERSPTTLPARRASRFCSPGRAATTFSCGTRLHPGGSHGRSGASRRSVTERSASESQGALWFYRRCRRCGREAVRLTSAKRRVAHRRIVAFARALAHSLPLSARAQQPARRSSDCKGDRPYRTHRGARADDPDRARGPPAGIRASRPVGCCATSRSTPRRRSTRPCWPRRKFISRAASYE
jgi:hypothetical protein